MRSTFMRPLEETRTILHREAKTPLVEGRGRTGGLSRTHLLRMDFNFPVITVSVASRFATAQNPAADEIELSNTVTSQAQYFISAKLKMAIFSIASARGGFWFGGASR
jgi:hypothetical protein